MLRFLFFFYKLLTPVFGFRSTKQILVANFGNISIILGHLASIRQNVREGRCRRETMASKSESKDQDASDPWGGVCVSG